MKALFLLLFMLVGYCSFSQEFLLDKRWKIKNKMEKFYAENNGKYFLTETDSTISYVLKDSLSLPLTSIFYFNDQDRCIKQENILSCDSCLQIFVQHALKAKFVNWKKVGPESYYAGSPWHAFMEQVRVNGQFIMRYTYIRRRALKGS